MAKKKVFNLWEGGKVGYSEIFYMLVNFEYLFLGKSSGFKIWQICYYLRSDLAQKNFMTKNHFFHLWKGVKVGYSGIVLHLIMVKTNLIYKKNSLMNHILNFHQHIKFEIYTKNSN